MRDPGGVEASRTALQSQEGSTIATAVEIGRGVVPEPHSLRMHSEIFRLGNHPSRHRKERDDAALPTQEGSSPAFTVTNILRKIYFGQEFSVTAPAVSSTKSESQSQPSHL
jgi:hypothetical protein